MTKTHLGDGAYAEMVDDGRTLRLSAPRGEHECEIFLGHGEWLNLLDFVRRIDEERATPPDQQARRDAWKEAISKS